MVGVYVARDAASISEMRTSPSASLIMMSIETSQKGGNSILPIDVLSVNGPRGNRTLNLVVKSHLLCQLSYRTNCLPKQLFTLVSRQESFIACREASGSETQPANSHVIVREAVPTTRTGIVKKTTNSNYEFSHYSLVHSALRAASFSARPLNESM